MRYLAVFLLLAGCATPQEMAETHKDLFGPYCDSLGYAKETNGWRQCITAQANRK